ncbi:N-formylglutamate amidohydrolase [Arenibaculum sp.]|jgi:N-formylglutamate amidohydrolase|uniref:N-formylglutamate amidohydrolase n=1 Tax=Arenibaculum sp. TaxID=2865862 RepID=UPI002E0EB5AE|nr:N-formylglutamate amidohydrolase [Arenibaculum sp.]
MSFVIQDVLVRDDPAGDRLPLVFDSPHSGVLYPADFGFVCPFSLLRQAEDTYVDELFAAVPEKGGTLLAALFPRSYVDVNRALDDIEPELIDGVWPWPLRPSEKSIAGMGLIRRLCRPGVPMYDGPLSVAHVAERIERYYRPYHEQLARLLDDLHRSHGRVFHVNCHSMPTLGVPGGPDAVDFVLGDRDGTTCGPDFTRLVADVLRGMGYRVRINDPYKGVELVRRYSNPARGIHSLQLEIHRGLYMNEDTLERNAGFEALRADLGVLIDTIADRCLLPSAAAAE